MDDYSCLTWVYLLKAKFDVSSLFHTFYTLIHTQSGTGIKSIHSDNAPEHAFLDYFREKRILPFHSCVDTLQQNFVVERKHQHFFNMARVLPFQSNIPLAY